MICNKQYLSQKFVKITGTSPIKCDVAYKYKSDTNCWLGRVGGLQIKRMNRLLQHNVTSVSLCMAYKIIITKDW